MTGKKPDRADLHARIRPHSAISVSYTHLLVVAAKTEADIAELETYEDRQMFLAEVGLEESGVARLIKLMLHQQAAAYQIIGTCQ